MDWLSMDFFLKFSIDKDIDGTCIHAPSACENGYRSEMF